MIFRVLHNVAPVAYNENYNTPGEINRAMESGDRLTFDGVYANVYAHRRALIHAKTKPILFITGDYVGGDNIFDVNMPPEMFASWDQVISMAAHYNCEIGWHSWSHANLTQVNDVELAREVAPPFPMRYFAYPYGAQDARVRKAVSGEGYERAFVVGDGVDADPFQTGRSYL
jgi:hypothetical protein